MSRRALTPLEVPYVVTNTTSSGGYVVKGTVSPDRLRAAYALLRREHPVLTGRIVVSDAGTGFDIETPDQPASAETATIAVEQRSFVPGDARLGLTPEVALSAVQLVIDGPLSRVTFGVNHAVGDGTYALALCLRLWELYTDPTTHTGPSSALPLSSLDFADRPGIVSTADAVGLASRTAAVLPRPEDLSNGEFAFERLHFTADETSAIRRRAKAAGLSLHGLLAGAVVLAERAELDVPDAEEVEMVVFTPVDMRARCTPPVEATSVTNFAGSSTAPLSVRADARPEEIGRRVLDQLVADLADGTVAAALTGNDLRPVTTGAPVRLSNIGAIPVPLLPVGLTAVDFHTSSEIDLTRIRQIAQVAPPAALTPLVGLHHHAMTFDGRLSLESRCAPGTLSPEAVRRIQQRIRHALVAPAEVRS